jgi:integrase
VSDPNVAPMHGWRHRFKTTGLEAGIPTRILDAIQGHAPRTAAEGYGEVTVKAMAQAMERVPRVGGVSSRSQLPDILQDPEKPFGPF